MTWPVTESARQKVTTCSAMSSTLAVRPSTACRRAPSATAGGSRFARRVPSTSPGATQLTVIDGASATARQRVRWISPALLAEYAMLLLDGDMPPTDAILTMRPAPWARRCGADARESR